MSRNAIKISKQHGLNPSIAACFFCGKDKGIVALGKLKGDAKAPTRAVFDYIPCEECAEKMKQGVTVIEVVRTDNGARPIQDGAWPTGRWCIISTEAARRLFKAGLHKKMLLEDCLYKQLVESNKKGNKANV